MNAPASGKPANFQVTLKKGIVEVVLNVEQISLESLRQIAREVAEITTVLRSNNQHVMLLVDARKQNTHSVSGQARIEGNEMLRRLDYDAIAVIGSGTVAAAFMYMLRITHTATKVQLFTSERKARAWLKDRLKPEHHRVALGLLAGLAIILIGASSLYGWSTDNQYLIRWITTLRPINPMAAVGLLFIGIGFISYWSNSLRVLRLTGIIGIALGIVALLPLNIDVILFGDKVRAAGAHTQLADSAALCFIGMGIVGLVAGAKGKWVRPLEYMACALMGGLAIFNIFGQLYAPDFIYGLGGNFVMAFNLAFAFAIATTTLILLVAYRQMGHNILLQVTNVSWVIVAALVIVQTVTYATWQQAVDRNNMESHQALTTRRSNIQNLTTSRLQAYITSLQGFSGFYSASQIIGRDEFNQYYSSLNLSENYPGLSSVLYISAIKDSDLKAFTAEMRSEGLKTKGAPFTPYPVVDAPVHYILTYVGGSTSTNSIGYDLSSVAGRQEVYSTALSKQGVYGSETVQVRPTATPDKVFTGFFLTTSTRDGSGTHTGIINAVLYYDTFFERVFKDNDLLKGIDLSVTDNATGDVIYRKDNVQGKASHTTASSFPVANRNWTVSTTAGPVFGIGDSQVRLPAFMLVVGQILSGFLLLLFWTQWRANRQAVALADDITQDLQFERTKAVASDQRSHAILSSIGDGVFVIDNRQRLTLLNPAARTIAGITDDEVLGKRYDDILNFRSHKTGKVNDAFIKKALGGHLASMSNHTVLVRKDGKQVPVADSAAPIRDAHNHIVGAIVVFRDISTEAELDKAKTEFVSLASHQLRTPLAAINWYGEMLLNGDAGKLTEEQTKYIQEIFSGSQRMVELVNSLLDVSRLEVGKLAYVAAENDIADLIKSVEQEVGITAKAKSIRLTSSGRGIPPVTADSKQLRMVVQNLLSNAVKYTPDKGNVHILLRAATTADIATAHLAEGKKYWTLEVKDTGYGIPVDQQPKIFSKLFRADNVQRMDVEGTGLGLYIVKGVVEQMGGRVWFESQENIGTTFTVVLPFKAKHDHSHV